MTTLPIPLRYAAHTVHRGRFVRISDGFRNIASPDHHCPKAVGLDRLSAAARRTREVARAGRGVPAR
jgi:hypothetical protein